MSFQQDLAAATQSFESPAHGAAAGTLAAPAGIMSPSTEQSDPRTIEVVAKRFAFEPARIEVTEGERIRLVVKSADGVHGIEIKKFKVNKKVPRGGDPVTIDFVAAAAGQYPILCSEYCGDGHEDMKGMLIVAAKSAGKH